MARLKKTVRLRELAPTVLKKADRTGRRSGALAVNAWPDVVGDEVARHTHGFALRGDGELVVFVDGAAWANQLSLMADEIQQRMNEHLGETGVRSLRFTVSKNVNERVTWEAHIDAAEDFYTPDEHTPVSLDPVELEQARHVAAAVRDPELRETALRAMVKDLELKKGARRSRDERWS